MRMIRLKADSEVVNGDLKNHEYKITHLDNNVMKMVEEV